MRLGLGLDLTTGGSSWSIDHEAMNLNTIILRLLERPRIPITLNTDREILETCFETCWKAKWEDASGAGDHSRYARVYRLLCDRAARGRADSRRPPARDRGRWRFHLLATSGLINRGFSPMPGKEIGGNLLDHPTIRLINRLPQAWLTPE